MIAAGWYQFGSSSQRASIADSHIASWFRVGRLFLRWHTRSRPPWWQRHQTVAGTRSYAVWFAGRLSVAWDAGPAPPPPYYDLVSDSWIETVPTPAPIRIPPPWAARHG